MHNLLLSLVVLFIALPFQKNYSQTPAVLSSAILYDSDPSMANQQFGYTNVVDIEGAFNNARRAEEMQFCLAANSITDIVLPAQVTWDSMNSDEKFLFLLNAERTTRAGLDYCLGDGPVSGLAFTGVESNIDAIAQAHADFLIANQSTQALSQASTIDQDPNIGGSGCNLFKGVQPDCCHTFLPFSVGSLNFTSNSTPADPSTLLTVGIEVRSVYFWIYGNGGTGNSRNMVLLQDIRPGNTSADPCGFVNDYGDAQDEGFIGIGIASGVPHPSTNRTHVDLVILSYFDPISQSIGCNYDCTSCGNCPTILTNNSIPIPNGHYQADIWVKSAGTIQSASTVSMSANDFVELNPLFEVNSGAEFHAYIDGCYFTIN